jgi:hypothetical protein
MANRSFTMDLTAPFAAYNWINFSRNGSQSLWFVLEESA